MCWEGRENVKIKPAGGGEEDTKEEGKGKEGWVVGEELWKEKEKQEEREKAEESNK